MKGSGTIMLENTGYCSKAGNTDFLTNFASRRQAKRQRASYRRKREEASVHEQNVVDSQLKTSRFRVKEIRVRKASSLPTSPFDPFLTANPQEDIQQMIEYKLDDVPQVKHEIGSPNLEEDRRKETVSPERINKHNAHKERSNGSPKNGHKNNIYEEDFIPESPTEEYDHNLSERQHEEEIRQTSPSHTCKYIVDITPREIQNQRINNDISCSTPNVDNGWAEETENSNDVQPIQVEDAVTIDNTVSEAVALIFDTRWEVALAGLEGLATIAEAGGSGLLDKHMGHAYRRIGDLVRGPRSRACRRACKCVSRLFISVRDTRRPGFDVAVSALLAKSADTCQFVRFEVGTALDAMVTHVSPYQAARALCSAAPQCTRNDITRTTLARLLACIAALLGPDLVLGPGANSGTRRRLLIHMIQALEDRCAQVREYANRNLDLLRAHPNFKHALLECGLELPASPAPRRRDRPSQIPVGHPALVDSRARG